jgi:single-strand DNA-binding protein
MNTVSLIGRLTADPDIRAGEKHESASFRLAVPRRSAERDAADFIDIVTFDTLAATCGGVPDQGPPGRRHPTPPKPKVSAGTLELGRLRLNEWTTPDGEHRSKLQFVADDVTFLDKPKAADSNGGQAAEAIPDRPAVGSYRRKAG